MVAARLPDLAGPVAAPAGDGHDVAGRRRQAAVEHAGDAGPLLDGADGRLQRVDLARKLRLLEQPVGWVLEGRLDVGVFEAEAVRDGVHQAPRVLDPRRLGARLARDERGVPPDRQPVLAPVEREGPARQAFAGIPLALAVVQEAAGGEAGPQAPDQLVGEAALARADRLSVPLGGLEVVDGDEGGLAAGGEAHVLRPQVRVDALAERVQRAPGLVREGQRDARRFRDPGHRHRVVEGDLALVERARDRRRRAVVRGRGERDVALAAEQARGGVEADPAGARQVDLGPGVEVREVVAGAERARHGVDVGAELDQVARHEARREAEAAQDRHHQPGRVAARARLPGQRLLGLVRARLHADHVGDLARQAGVDVDQEVDRAARLARDRVEEGLHPGRGGRVIEIGGDLGARLGVVGEGEDLGGGLDEEVERVDHRHLGGQVDLDAQVVGLLREDEAGEPVAVRVLLPVDEVAGRADLQRIARDLGAAVGRRPQADHLRAQRDGPVVAIIGDVIDRGAHRHRGLLG